MNSNIGSSAVHFKNCVDDIKSRCRQVRTDPHTSYHHMRSTFLLVVLGNGLFNISGSGTCALVESVHMYLQFRYTFT